MNDSGITITEMRTESQRTTRAFRLHAAIALFEARQDARELLGQRPQWWRPFARKRWDRENAELCAIEKQADDLLAEIWSDRRTAGHSAGCPSFDALPKACTCPSESP